MNEMMNAIAAYPFTSLLFVAHIVFLTIGTIMASKVEDEEIEIVTK